MKITRSLPRLSEKRFDFSVADEIHSLPRIKKFSFQRRLKSSPFGSPSLPEVFHQKRDGLDSFTAQEKKQYTVRLNKFSLLKNPSFHSL